MPKYRVILQTVAETVVEVEADSKEDAYDQALNEPMPRICAQCSGWGDSQNLSINSDGWDIDQEAGLDECVEEVSA